MKLHYFLFSITIWTGILSGCNKEENSFDLSEFTGYYKIISIQSAKPVDMNNDGIQSYDLLSEISNFHIINGERVANYYNSIIFRAEVRPLPGQINDYQFISFNYPYQIIGHEEDDDPLLMWYSPHFMTYRYEIKPGNEIEVIDFNPDYNSAYGEIHSLTRIDAVSFEIKMSIRLYDFTERSWIDTEVMVRYYKDE